MRYYFRLAELIGYEPGTNKRPGLIKQIEEETKLDRHLVSDLLKNKRKAIPLDALSRLCDFLVRHGFVPATDLPGALFAVEPERFWGMLAERKRFELCLGVRKSREPDLPGALLSAADAVLLGEMLNGVSTLGGTSQLLEGEPVLPTTGEGQPAVHAAQFKQSLVWSPGQLDDTKVAARALSAYTNFLEISHDHSLVCLGSVKSNPVIELIMASVFGSTPYQPNDDVAHGRDRNCPLFLRYRDADPHPKSCCAGMQLSANESSDTPGIYYEVSDGSWECAPSQGNEDAAMVFFVHREAQNRVEMVIGGFSGRATRAMAKMLRSQPDNFWPPSCICDGTRIGAFVVKFQFPPDGEDEDDLVLLADLPEKVEVVTLDHDVIQRRLEKAVQYGFLDKRPEEGEEG